MAMSRPRSKALSHAANISTLRSTLSESSVFPVDRNHSEGDEEPCDERVAEERGGGEVVHLPREHRPREQRIEQVIRMVDAKQHRTRGRYPLGVANLDALEEEPDPEPRDRPHDGVEGVHYSLGLRPGGRYLERSPRRRMSCGRPICLRPGSYRSTPNPSSPPRIK